MNITPILQIKKLKYSESLELGQGHTASRYLIWDLNPGNLSLECLQLNARQQNYGCKNRFVKEMEDISLLQMQRYSNK